MYIQLRFFLYFTIIEKKNFQKTEQNTKEKKFVRECRNV